MLKIKNQNKVQFIFSLIFNFLFLGLIALNLYFSFSNGDASSQQSNFIVTILHNFLSLIGINVDITDPTFNMLTRKLIGHFGLFFVTALAGTLSVVLSKPNYKKKTLKLIFVLLIGILLAVGTEYIQSFQEGRGPSYKDTLIDLSGFLIPIVIYGIYLVISINSISIAKNAK